MGYKQQTAWKPDVLLVPKGHWASPCHLQPPSSSSSSQSVICPFVFPITPLTIARRTDFRFKFSRAEHHYPDLQNSYRMVFGRYAKADTVFTQMWLFFGKRFDRPVFEASCVIWFSLDDFRRMTALQKVNFMPASAHCRKDRLHRTLFRTKQLFHPDDFSFWPDGFVCWVLGCLPGLARQSDHVAAMDPHKPPLFLLVNGGLSLRWRNSLFSDSCFSFLVFLFSFFFFLFLFLFLI